MQPDSTCSSKALPTLRHYLLARCKALGASVHSGIANKRMLALAVSKEQVATRGKLMPPCFGLRFAAPDDPTCRECHVQVLCLHMAANKTLLRVQDQCSTRDVSTVARAMDIEPRSVLFMQKTAAALGTITRAQVNRGKAPPTPHHIRDKTWPTRHLRERMRLPFLERLKPGTVLRRNYDGVDHIVCVRHGYYEYLGEQHPTLYDVVMTITGAKVYQRTNEGYRDRRRAISNFSVRRFFWKSFDEALPGL